MANVRDIALGVAPGGLPGGYNYKTGGQAHFSGLNIADLIRQYQQDKALPAYNGDGEAGLSAMQARQAMNFGNGRDKPWGYGGYDVIPLPNGGYGIAKGMPGAQNATGFGIFGEQPMDVYDASGKFMGTGMTPKGLNPNDDSMKQFAIGAAFMAPMALAAAGALGGAAGAGGAGAGAGAGSGASAFAGQSLGGIGGGLEGTALGSAAGVGTAAPFAAGAIDPALAASIGGSAALGGGIGGSSAAAGGAGGSGGASAGGTAAATGAGAGGGAGVPPPANPFVTGGGSVSSIFPSLGGLSQYIGPGVSALGGLLSANASKDAASQAAQAQMAAAQAGIGEWARQFDTVRGLLGPYANTGAQAMGAQADLTGLNGAAKQQAAVDALQQMPAFQSQLKLAENRILQNASATGGLRGGNTQGALAWFAPSLLAQQIQDQYTRLGGLANLGENAAAGVGNAAMTTAGGSSGLMQQSGAAQAGSAIAGGVADQRMYGSLATAIGQMFGYGGNPMTAGVPTPV